MKTSLAAVVAAALAQQRDDVMTGVALVAGEFPRTIDGERESQFKPTVSDIHGGNLHAANEFYVVEGAGKVYGMAGAEKSLAAVPFNYAGKT